MIQGDVYRYSFKEPDKRRPVLILTRNSLIPELNAITVVPITTTIRDAGTQVLIDESDGMSEACSINLASVQTVPKDKISGYITHLSDGRMQEVFEAIKYTFGFDK
jgi:mRNA interferase MazF